jgi:2-C-methyl-D-erythritol 4-phosphate cytidylyltransferase
MSHSSELSEKYWVVVPAAGEGLRFGADRPKQYMDLLGEPIIKYTLDKWIQYSKTSKIIVAIAEDDHYWPQVYSQLPSNLAVVCGGASRAASVLNGLESLQGQAHDDDWVFVHDAVRPCVTYDAINSLVAKCDGHHVGGVLGYKMYDTIKEVDQSCHITKTVDRDFLWCAQTPQMFRYGLLHKALSLAISSGGAVTDEAGSIELLGFKPLMVHGDRSNIKITRHEDLVLARWNLQQGV